MVDLNGVDCLQLKAFISEVGKRRNGRTDPEQMIRRLPGKYTCSYTFHSVMKFREHEVLNPFSISFSHR